MRNRFFIPLMVLLFISEVPGQKYPVSVFTEMVTESAGQIKSEAAGKKGFTLRTAFAGDLNLFENTITDELSPLTSGEAETGNEISYTLMFAGFTHGEVFKSSIFGDYLVERKFEIGGSWSVASGGNLKQQEFSISKTDTVTLKEYRASVRANDFGLRGEMPDPPLFDGIFEPVLIIGSLASLVAAFFLIRAN